MDFRARLKRHLHAHRHTGARFLVGLTLTLFICTLTGSDARVPDTKRDRPSVAATASLVTTALKPAASEESETSSSTSSAETVSAGRASSSVEHRRSSPIEDTFPPFMRTVNIVSRVPNWGAMRSPEEWNRAYGEMTDADFVPMPAYQIPKLMVPMKELTNPITPETIPEITRKLVYSTRYFGAYDLDAGEFTAVHPGVDIKLARGTPVGAIAGGRVHAVSTTKVLGLHVIIEHRIAGEAYYSIYGHFDTASVSPGQTVKPGQIIGTVGMTGNTSAPHVHLQIDRGVPGESNHVPYLPSAKPSASEASRYVTNPMAFIAAYVGGM